MHRYFTCQAIGKIMEIMLQNFHGTILLYQKKALIGGYIFRAAITYFVYMQ